jgi:hypothetical protein
MASGNGVTLGPLTPRGRFYPASDQCAGARPLSRSGRNPLLDTAFRSPSATIYLAANLRGRVNVPGLHLRNDSETFLSPFGFELLSPFGFFIADARYDHRSQPVAKSDLETQYLLSGLRSPSGFLNPSGS